MGCFTSFVIMIIQCLMHVQYWYHQDTSLILQLRRPINILVFSLTVVWVMVDNHTHLRVSHYLNPLSITRSFNNVLYLVNADEMAIFKSYSILYTVFGYYIIHPDWKIFLLFTVELQQRKGWEPLLYLIILLILKRTYCRHFISLSKMLQYYIAHM